MYRKKQKPDVKNDWTKNNTITLAQKWVRLCITWETREFYTDDRVSNDKLWCYIVNWILQRRLVEFFFLVLVYIFYTVSKWKTKIFWEKKN